MEQNLLIALTGFIFVTSVTPGPNNMMLMASGVNFGLRRTVPHMLGVGLGFGGMVAVLGLGVDAVFARWPVLGEILKWLSLGYMVWLAWKIATAGEPKRGRTGARPLTFLQAAGFQWVNPKAWAMALGALSAYAAGVGGAMVVALVTVLAGLPSVLIWAAAGLVIRRALTSERRLRLFNRTMAAGLLLSMWPVLMH